MLEKIVLNQVAPFKDPTTVAVAPRLNLLTGDNGAGKTFLLDLAWTALTRSWKSWDTWFDAKGTDEPSLVIEGHRAEVNTRYQQMLRYSFSQERWLPGNARGSEIPADSAWSGPVLYMKSSGAYNIWDPARDASFKLNKDENGLLEFSSVEVLEGLRRLDGKVLCDGLIRDLVNWQRSSSTSYLRIESVLETLSEPGEPLKLGEPTRLTVDDVRDFPTLVTGYGSVPFVKCSAGAQRIVSLAYLLVWMWDEHVRSCQLRRLQPTRRMVLLLDEVECHLHPRWQRLVLPALLDAARGLTEGQVEFQILAATHAPLVLASMEARFEENKDALFHFESEQHRVTVNQVEWQARGESDSWLTSEAFGLKTSRSLPAETAILTAMEAMKSASEPEKIRQIHAELREVLGDTDPFWPRWRYFAEKHGLDP